MSELSFKLENFFNYYEYSNQKSLLYEDVYNIADSLIEKQEFNELKYEGFLPHQTLVARWMGPNTIYDKLLVFHGLGTGKTCLMSAVGELAIQQSTEKPKIIILTPNESLQKNVLNEIAYRCTSGRYIASGENVSEEVQKSRTLSNIRDSYLIKTVTGFLNIIEGLNPATLKEEYNGSYLFIDEAHNLFPSGKSSIEDAEKYKHIQSFINAVPGLKVMLLTGTPMRNSPEELVPLLNLLLPATNQLEREGFMKKWYQDNKIIQQDLFIHQYLQNNISYLRSISSNQISYADLLYTTELAKQGRDVDEEEYNPLFNEEIQDAVEKEKRDDQVRVIHCGTTNPPLINYTRLVQVDMDSYQTRTYKKVFNEEKVKLNPNDQEDETESIGLALKSQHASSFVFPPRAGSKEGKVGIEEERNWLDITYKDKDNKIIQSFELNPAFKGHLNENGDTVQNKLSQLKKCSAKFAFAIEQILKYPNQKMFIYSREVQGGGCLLFSALLQEFGFSDTSSSNQINDMVPKRRFAFLSSLSSKSSDIDTLVNKICNDSRNIYGDYVQVLIGSDIVSEGLSFKHIRKMFVMTPFWNMASTDQAIGRAIRAFGHDELPPEKRIVGVYRMCAIPADDTRSIDLMIYHRAETKDIKIKQMERILKRAAWDCFHNKDKNRNKLDVDGSRECDYQSCDYECDAYINKKEPWQSQERLRDTVISSSLPYKKRFIQDTYNLFYGNQNLELISSIVKRIFKFEFSMPFEVLLEKIKGESKREPQVLSVNSILLARSLYKIITHNEELINRYGLKNYLREDRNLYFLVDDPSGPSSYMMSWYAEHPIPSKELSPDDAVKVYFSKQISILNEVLLEHQNNPSQIKTILENSPVWLAQQYIELVFASSISNDKNLNVILSETIKSIYEKGLFKIDGHIAHNFFGTWRILINEKERDDGNVFFFWRDAIKEEEIKTTAVDTRFEVDKKLAALFGYEANIPPTYDPNRQFSDLRIKTLFRAKETMSGGMDQRFERSGLTCGTSRFSKFSLVKWIFEICLICIKNNIDVPLANYTPKITQQLSNDPSSHYIKHDIKKDLERWIKILIISDELEKGGDGFEILQPLRKTLSKNNKLTFCTILGLSQDECNAEIDLEKNPELDKRDFIAAINYLSDNIINEMFVDIIGRKYQEDDLDFYLNKDIPNTKLKIKDILLRAINSPNKDDLCGQIGKWFQDHKLLGFYLETVKKMEEKPEKKKKEIKKK